MIIDFHTHVFPERIASATVAALEKNGNTKAYSDGTVNGLLSALAEAGAHAAVNLPVLTKPTQFDSILRFAAELTSASYGEARIISFAGIHPDDENYEEHIEAVRAAGLLGIKIHPDYQNTFFDDERYVKILACAKKNGLITVTHAGLDGAYIGEPIKCTPERVLRLLDRIGGYPELVLAHLGGNELYSDVLQKLAGEDVYFDTAYSLHSVTAEQFRTLLDKHGEDKILFATDSPWRNIREEVRLIRSYKLGAETEAKLFSENAKKLLKIKDSI